MEFQKRKSAALAAMNSAAPDKSPKGTIDAPIIPLLISINSHPSYFTTSSCSGRISILSQPTASPSSAKKKARGGTWLLLSHEPVHPSSVSALLFPSRPPLPDAMEEQSIVFRFEPLIIAVECVNVEAAQSLVSLAIACGFRESGITSVSKRTIIAIRCSIRMEVPLGSTHKLMVTPEYVEYLVGIANEKMGTNRKRTDHFHNKLSENGFPGTEIEADGEIIGNGEETYLEAKRIEVLGSSEVSEMEVLEGQLGPESKYNRNVEYVQVFGVDLSVIEVVGEPVERLFLWGHSSCTLSQKKIIIFGGFGGIGRHARRNDLLIFDAKSGFAEVIVAAGAPSPRLGHTSSPVGDFIYVIGGRADPMNILNDVWVFHMPKKEWKLLICSGSLFPPRHRHAAAVVGSKIYVFGGIHDNSVLSSIYVFDTVTSEWSEIQSHGDLPGPRHSHSMDAKGSKLFMFGGYDGDKALGDLYTFDIQRGLWSKLKTIGQSPNARFSHLMFVYSNFLGILGGCPVTEHQELFLLNLQSNCWKKIVVKSVEECLFVRSTISMVGDYLIIIGGGASCYAFGTKFSVPMKINLLQLISVCHNSENTENGEKHMTHKMEQKSAAHLHSQSVCKEKVNGCPSLNSEFEEVRVASGEVPTPCVLQVDRQYAKMAKDLLKNFGWLDLERKVYSQEGGLHICLPVTNEFCRVLEDNQGLADKLEPLTDQLSKPTFWQILLKDISSSAALNLLMSFGATKMVDEVIKVKKTLNSPFKIMKEAVASFLEHHGQPANLIEQLPSRWERLGGIIVLPVTSFKDEVWNSIGEKLWPLVARALGAQRLARQGRIAQTETRDSKLEILVGDDGWVDHRENGILYSFDATKCMFSWGNLSEKLRMAHLDCRDQVVVDLFAGIGYFVLPFLVRANAKMVYACEWNPHAIEALHRNLSANHVADRCVVLEGDNRVTAPKGVAHRVCLGLIPSSECSWATAVTALRDEGGVLHIHGNVKDTEEGVWTNHVVEKISEISKSEGRLWEVWVEHVERVKWYAPRIRHLVVDVRCKGSQR
ncbi:tRNA wybutosine-synthesizing protein 2/3/4 isoform X2 [Salvia miltiorrhiza]|uniref:tRNA wybutosine-synthesizing protein 2/3/4 isoform X2 n=1 Tax=Salvia miltiorrhiza TaxID=226208 RepID=UPI0025AD8FE5|nr:tRNA wybutosine-synthesizing protein 2/3/4 isoform X2 [Salvia miltiorrhiza]